MNKEILKKLRDNELEILDEIVRICGKHNLNYCLIGGTLLGAIKYQGFIPWDDDIDISMPRVDYEKFIKIAKIELNPKYIIDKQNKNSNYWLPFLKIRKLDTIYEEKSQKNYNGLKGIWVDIFPLDNSKNDYSKWLKIRFDIVGHLRCAIAIKKKVMAENNKSKTMFVRKLISLLPYPLLLKVQTKFMTINKNETSKYFVNLGSQYGAKKQTHLKEKYFPGQLVSFENRKYNVPNDYNYVLKKIYGKGYMEYNPPKEEQITHNPRRIKFKNENEVIFDEEI